MGRSPCCDKVGLKKGPWTPEEDQKLLAFIQEHGHGSWRALPPKAGLQRCGKSCRLRWTNYLRPDIKRGKFSLQEEQTIIQLHALLGNRWSAIASHLPKRTDNEIKNYWNTHLKKRLVKMGIDPTTHKPKNHALGCTHPSKHTANLSHMAQWETARLEAEARIVRESSSSTKHHYLMSTNNIISYNNNNLNSSSSAAPRPPCLDILKVWQGTWARNRKSSGPLSFLDSPTSILNFSDNNNNSTTVVPNGLIHVQNTLNNINYQDEPLQLQGKMLHLHDQVPTSINNYVNAAADHHSLRFPSFMDAFADDLPPATTTADDHDVFEDNKINYWTNILNVVNSPMGSPVF